MDHVKEQKERERLFREKEVPFEEFTLREKTRWWNAVELENVFGALCWQKGASLLDIGASDGRMLAFVRQRDPRAYLVGTDFALNPLIVLRGRDMGAGAVCADAATQVFKSCSFDRAVSLQVMQQIPSSQERSKAFGAVHQALKPGGMFVLTVLNRPSWKGLVFNGKEGPLLSAPDLCVYLYDVDELKQALVSAGFEVLGMKAINNLPVRYLKRLGVLGVWIDRLISVCLTKLSAQKGRYLLATCRKK
jgi:SAM-dependent methyltransferase